jgi:aminopeptidase
MPDPRISKLAKVIINYSLRIKPGDQFLIQTSPIAQELTQEIFKEAVLAGAHITTQISTPGLTEIFLKNAGDEQLEHVSPVYKLVIETYQAMAYIDAPTNTRGLTGVDPAKMAQVNKANQELAVIQMERAAKKELNWNYTVYPTNAQAQEADMSLSEYQDFVYNAGLLDLDDPVAEWTKIEKQQDEYIKWLEGHDKVVIKGSNVDLTMSVKDRPFINACGHENFPDGEIFTSPIEDSTNGWIRFRYPAIYGGREVEDVELWFEDGKIVKEKASKAQDFLTITLNTDDGARYLGELGIGTNYGITKFTKHMLFDEKIGGTIHLATGFGFPECNSQNKSAIHWDMLCDMEDGEITFDGDTFYKNGKIAV